MPNVTAPQITMSNGDVVTEFRETASATSTAFTYATTQNRLIIKNNGAASITFTAGSVSQTLQPNGSYSGDTDFTSLVVQSSANTQEFIARATKKSGSVGGGSGVSAGMRRNVPLFSTCFHSDNPTTPIKAILRRGFEFIWVSELVAYLEGRGSLPVRPFLLTYDDCRRDFYNLAHPVLQQYKVKTTVFLPSGYVDGETVDASLSSWPPMTWDQVKEVHATGLYEWGNHTRYHKDLRTQTSAQRIADLTHCNNALKNNLGVTAISIAYPMGSSDPGTYVDARSLGLKIGFSFHPSKYGRTSMMFDDPFTLNRLSSTDSLLENCTDDVFIHWGWDITGGRNENNKLDFWTHNAGTNFGYQDSGETLRMDSRVSSAAFSCATTDYFRVRSSDVLHAWFYARSELQTAGNCGMRILQFDQTKVALPSIDLKTMSAAQGFAITEKEFQLDAACTFIKFEMWSDVAYDGLVSFKDLTLKRANVAF